MCAMKYNELTLGQVEAIVNKLGGMDGVRRFLSGITSAFNAIVNRSLSLKEMISAGNYGWVNDDITASHFPIKGSGTTETGFELVHFDRDVSSEDAVAELDKRGLRPADLAELLAFGAVFPEEQRKYPIVELGSVAEVGCGRYVAYLFRGVSRRDLCLFRWGVIWNAGCRFLAVCK